MLILKQQESLHGIIGIIADTKLYRIVRYAHIQCNLYINCKLT